MAQILLASSSVRSKAVPPPRQRRHLLQQPEPHCLSRSSLVVALGAMAVASAGRRCQLRMTFSRAGWAHQAIHQEGTVHSVVAQSPTGLAVAPHLTIAWQLLRQWSLAFWVQVMGL